MQCNRTHLIACGNLGPPLWTPIFLLCRLLGHHTHNTKLAWERQLCKLALQCHSLYAPHSLSVESVRLEGSKSPASTGPSCVEVQLASDKPWIQFVTVVCETHPWYRRIRPSIGKTTRTVMQHAQNPSSVQNPLGLKVFSNSVQRLACIATHCTSPVIAFKVLLAIQAYQLHATGAAPDAKLCGHIPSHYT